MWKVEDIPESVVNKEEITSTVVKYVHGRLLMCVIPLGSRLYISGVTQVWLAWGSAEIFGYRLKTLSPVPIFSLAGCPSLSISPISCPGDSSLDQFSTPYDMPLPPGLVKRLKKYLRFGGAIVYLEPLYNGYDDFLKGLTNYGLNVVVPMLRGPSTNLSEEECTVNCLLDEGLECARIRNKCLPRDDWDQLCSDLSSYPSMPRTIICGGKGVGKSVLLRYCINRLLDNHKQVLVVDTDIGQSEFTIAGCLSAVLVSAPLLGPSYTHLQTPELSYYVGHVDVNRCISAYLKYFNLLIETCEKKFSEIPWVVNCMGYCKGLGVPLTYHIILKSTPTHVVEVRHWQNGLSYDEPLTVESVKKNVSTISFHGLFEYSFTALDFSYNHLIVPSFIQEGQSKPWTPNSRQMRQLSTLFYFNAPNVWSLNSQDSNQNLPFLELPLDKFTFKCTEDVKEELAVGVNNGQIVALCQEVEGVFICLGYGKVRGIERSSSPPCAIIETPVPQDRLLKMTTLYQGKLGLTKSPNELLTFKNRIPYAVAGLLNAPVFKPAHRSFYRTRHDHIN